MYAALHAESDLDALIERYCFEANKRGLQMDFEGTFRTGLDILEAMVGEGWVTGGNKPNIPYLGFASAYPDQHVHIGWIKEDVGLTSINPRDGGKVVIELDEFTKLRAPA